MKKKESKGLKMKCSKYLVLIRWPLFLIIICMIILELTYFNSLKLIYKSLPGQLETYGKIKNQEEYRTITITKGKEI